MCDGSNGICMVHDTLEWEHEVGHQDPRQVLCEGGIQQQHDLEDHRAVDFSQMEKQFL